MADRKGTRAVGDLLGDSGADFSPCGRYRYRLWRRWGDGPTVLFAMLNPSTADATVDDPTIRRCIGFARRLYAGGLIVVNLYAWRATHPRELKHALEPVGRENDQAIAAAAAECAVRIAAWGACTGKRRMRADAVAELLLRTRWDGQPRDLYALKLTAAGDPWHPLYLPNDAEILKFRRWEVLRAA